MCWEPFRGIGLRHHTERPLSPTTQTPHETICTAVGGMGLVSEPRRVDVWETSGTLLRDSSGLPHGTGWSHTCFPGWGPARCFLRTWSSEVSRSLLRVQIVSVPQEASEYSQGLRGPRWGEKICELKSPGPSRYRTRMWAKLPTCL